MGYDLNCFTTNIDPFLFCPLCRRVLENPILFDCPVRKNLSLENSNYLINSKSYFNQTHVFCETCIFEKLENNENIFKCPIDGKQLKKNLKKNLFKSPPAWITEQLNKLKISCDNFGCKAILAISDLKLHRKMCEYNPHRATTPSLHMLDANSHFSPYHPHRPSSIPTPGPSIMNQMHAAAAASNQHPTTNLHSSAASANIHHHPQAPTWYNDFDNWSMYEHHHSMVNPISNQSSQVSQPIIPTPSLTQSSHNVHHSISVAHQQHHLSANGPMFNSHSQLPSPSQQSSLTSISNKQQYPTPGLNQASLSSLHSNPLSVSLTQQHNQSSQSISGLSSLSSTPSAQQNHFTSTTHSSQPILNNQQYQSQQSHFSHQQSSFINPQKQNSSVQSLPSSSSSQRNSTTSKQSLTMPPPPPSPSTQFSQNSSLISPINHNSKNNIDLEKIFDFRIQQIDERLKQNFEEIRSLLKQKVDIETNNHENKIFNDCLNDLKQEIDSFKKTNELIETKINEKLTEKESSFRKFFELQNPNQQIAVATSTANSTSKPFKKQKSRHFDNSYENSDEQNELSSTVDTPTDNLNGNYLYSDSDSINSKIQAECDKFLNTNLTSFLEKTKFFTSLENQLNKEIKVFRTDIQEIKLLFEQKIQDQLSKINVLENNLNSPSNKNNEKKSFNSLEENSNFQKILSDKYNSTQKDLNKIKLDYNKQKFEIEQLKKLLGKYEKLYCDEKLIDEEDEIPDNSSRNEKLKPKLNDKNENLKIDVKKEIADNNQKSFSLVKDKKNNKSSNETLDLSKNLKISKQDTNELTASPIKSRLRKPKEKKCSSDLYMDDLDKFTDDFNNTQLLKAIKNELKFKEKKSNVKNDLAKNKRIPKKDSVKNKNSKVKKISEENEKTEFSKDSKDVEKAEEKDDNEKNVVVPSLIGSEKKIGKSSKNKLNLEEVKNNKELESNNKIINSKENLKKIGENNELKNDDKKINQEKSIEKNNTEQDLKENKDKKTKDPTDLLAKIVNEVLFTEPDQNTSTTSTFNPQFTFTQQPSTTILRPFFDPTGLSLNSNKFLVSLTRTINQPNVSAPQMLLVNSTLKQAQTSICNNVMTTSTPTFISTTSTNMSSNNLLESFKTNIKNSNAQSSVKIDETIQKNSSITSTTLDLKNKNLSKLDNSEELIIKDKNAKKEINKKKKNKTQTCSSILNKKRSSSRISFKQNEKTIDFNKQLKEKIEPVKNIKKRESITNDENGDNIEYKDESINKRKRRKTNEVSTKSFEEIQATFLNDPKLANIKLTTGQNKKNSKNKVGQSILLDSPSSTTSKITLKKKLNNSKSNVDLWDDNAKSKSLDDKKSKKYLNEYDSATDCEEDESQVKKKSIKNKKNIKDKKLIDTVSKNLKKLVEKKQASSSLDKVTSSTNEIPDCSTVISNDYKSQEISSSTSDKNDNKKKKKKVNDYVKRRRSKPILNEKKKEIKNDCNLTNNCDDIIMNTIDNVISKSFAEKNDVITTGLDKLKKDNLNKEKNLSKIESKNKKTKSTEKLKKKFIKSSVSNETSSLELGIKNKKAEKNTIKSFKKTVKETDISKTKKVLKTSLAKANKDKNTSSSNHSSFFNELTDSSSKINSINVSNNTKKNQTKNNFNCDNMISTSSSFESDNKVVSNYSKKEISTENEEFIIKDLIYKLIDSVVHNK